VAKEAFGDSAEDVMTQRAEIRKLSDAKFEAINKAKKEGAEWSDKAVKQQESKMAELNQEVSTSYKQAVKAFESNPKYAEFFQPIEGDEVANTTLTDGYAMVDRAFAANPMDPKLTPEQRKSVVKLHAAIKHRAAAFGRVKYLLQKEREGRAADRKKLSQYESTVPNRDGSKPAAASSSFTGTGSKMAAAEARLRARAK
jgi:hypothetical protein